MTARKKPTELDTSASELDGMLADLARSASDDESLPMINGVLLYSATVGEHHRVYGASTDRFVMAMAHASAAGELPAVFLPLDSVAVLRKMLATRVAHGTRVRLFPNRSNELVVNLDGGTRVVVPLGSAARFPDISRFTHTPAEHLDGLIIQPRFLANFVAIAKRRRENPRWSFAAPVRPSAVTIGDSYHAIVMPVRDNDQAPKFQPAFPSTPLHAVRPTT